jgi:hypothetical protein
MVPVTRMLRDPFANTEAHLARSGVILASADRQLWRRRGLSPRELDRPPPRDLGLRLRDLGLPLRASCVRLGKSLLSFGELLALVGDLLRVLFGIPCRRHLGTHCPMSHCGPYPKTNAEDDDKSNDDYRP